MKNKNNIIGQHDIVFITFDTLRYDVAQGLFNQGETPNLETLLATKGWEKRHTPGSFTYAAHHAFFAGFLPTPAKAGKHPRLFATKFLGSETTTENTIVFEEADIVNGLKNKGYHTICLGGVGFFNKQTPLSKVFPSLFDESHWSPKFGVTNPDSTKEQFQFAAKRLSEIPKDQRVFLFINLSALHQPNYFYLDGAKEDSLESHGAALKYIDSQIPLLVRAILDRAPAFCIFCADHGTTYGEDGYFGHRLAHPKVWEVPYSEFFVQGINI